MKIAAVIMVKNEMHRIHVTLQSIGKLDALIVFDTGSTDGTVEYVLKSSPIPVHLKEGTFVNFKVSSNELLDFADACAEEFGYDYYVQLDANDEFVGERPTITNLEQKSWFVERHLKYGDTDAMIFWAVKLLKARTGIRYDGVVHEYLVGCDDATYMRDFHIFQNRCLDTDKSQLRWPRDKLLLEEEHEKNPTEPRTLFYLAQTYACLGENQKAYDTYEKRTRSVDGFEEERWYAAMQCATLSIKLDMDWDTTTVVWLMKALSLDVRVEPLVALADHYWKKNAYELAYRFAKMACDLPYPDRLLFIEKKAYEYSRWHILGIVAYYVAKRNGDDRETYEIGRQACQKAIDANCNVELNKNNMKWYERAMSDVVIKIPAE